MNDTTAQNAQYNLLPIPHSLRDIDLIDVRHTPRRYQLTY